MPNKPAKDGVVTSLSIVAGLSIFPLFLGCMTLEQMAPPIGEQFQTVAARHGVDITTLEAGRRVYLTDCVRCHGVEPISRYTAERWHEILPRMAAESYLDDQRTTDVEAYVTLALALFEERAKTESEIAARPERTSTEVILGTSVAGGSR